MKKVLFISYYWPPSGKASLQWPLKIIKHLPGNGWMPLVLTVDEDTFSQKDDSFANQIPAEVKVFKAKSYEPFNIYKKFIGKKENEQLVASETISKKNKTLAHRLSIWIRMNLFIPDARVGWYFPAIKEGVELLKQENVDAVVSIGPPHTTHLIGKKLSAKNKLPHIPIFIDPWVDISYYRSFKRNKLTLSIDNRLEKSVLKNCASVVFVTETMRKDYENKYSFIKEKSNVLYWGYSEEDFEGLPSALTNKEKEGESILHAGNIFEYQNPKYFWPAVKKEIENGRKFKLKFIGTVDPAIKESITRAGLNNVTEYAGFLPYKNMLKEICNADLLLVCATEPRHVPGKLFEYLRAGKPIIAFGDENDEVKEIINNANAGMMFSYSESGVEFFSNKSNFQTNQSIVKAFERNSIAQKFSEILNSLYS